MANILRRISGKFGQILLQVGATTVASDTTSGNATAETVDGITYDAYQVYTLATAGNIPMDPNTIPTVAIAQGAGPALPPAITYDVNYLRGKIVVTPALGAANTVTPSSFAKPKMYAMSDHSEFSLDATQAMIDATPAMKNWTESTVGFHSWNGSATLYYRNDQGASGNSWWLSGAGAAQENPVVLYFYPAKTIGTEYWIGAALLDWGIKVPKGGMLEQSIKISGVGPLIYKNS